jgi:hypothetical protein
MVTATTEVLGHKEEGLQATKRDQTGQDITAAAAAAMWRTAAMTEHSFVYPPHSFVYPPRTPLCTPLTPLCTPLLEGSTGDALCV